MGPQGNGSTSVGVGVDVGSWTRVPGQVARGDGDRGDQREGGGLRFEAGVEDDLGLAAAEKIHTRSQPWRVWLRARARTRTRTRARQRRSRG